MKLCKGQHIELPIYSTSEYRCTSSFETQHLLSGHVVQSMVLIVAVNLAICPVMNRCNDRHDLFVVIIMLLLLMMISC